MSAGLNGLGLKILAARRPGWSRPKNQWAGPGWALNTGPVQGYNGGVGQ